MWTSLVFLEVQIFERQECLKWQRIPNETTYICFPICPFLCVYLLSLEYSSTCCPSPIETNPSFIFSLLSMFSLVLLFDVKVDLPEKFTQRQKYFVWGVIPMITESHIPPARLLGCTRLHLSPRSSTVPAFLYLVLFTDGAFQCPQKIWLKLTGTIPAWRRSHSPTAKWGWFKTLAHLPNQILSKNQVHTKSKWMLTSFVGSPDGG